MSLGIGSTKESISEFFCTSLVKLIIFSGSLKMIVWMRSVRGSCHFGVTSQPIFSKRAAEKIIPLMASPNKLNITRCQPWQSKVLNFSTMKSRLWRQRFRNLKTWRKWCFFRVDGKSSCGPGGWSVYGAGSGSGTYWGAGNVRRRTSADGTVRESDCLW